MLTPQELKLIECVSKKCQIDYTERFLNNKKENTYPYWLFKSSKPTTNFITLEMREIDVCKWLGPQRTASSRQALRQNMRQTIAAKEEFIEINGLCGELVFAKKYNLYPYSQFEIKARTVEEDDGDFKLNDYIIDVKTTEYYTGRLICSSWKNKIPDIYCLMTGDYRRSNNFKIAGYLTSADLIQPAMFSPLPGGKTSLYNAFQNQLYSLDAAFTKLENMSK